MMINTSLLDNHVFLFNVYSPIFKSEAQEQGKIKIKLPEKLELRMDGMVQVLIRP